MAPFAFNVTFSLFNLTPVGLICTVTLQVAVMLPSSVDAVISAVPLPMALTSPSLSTDAALSSLLAQQIFSSAALFGLTVTASCSVCWGSVNVRVSFFRLSFVTLVDSFWILKRCPSCAPNASRRTTGASSRISWPCCVSPWVSTRPLPSANSR